MEILVGGSSVWLHGGVGCTHLWVQGLQALLWDLGIQGALEPRGDQWSLVLGASSGARPVARFALLENKDQACIHQKCVT